MKSKIFVALCALSTTCAFAVEKQEGTINLEGYIYSATCEIDINNQGPDNAVVKMGRHPTSAFDSVGDETGGTGTDGKITVKLKNCPDEGNLELYLDGTTVGSSDTILQLDNAGASTSAKGVGIHIYDEDNLSRPLKITGSDVSLSADVKGSKTYTKNLIAKYVSTQKTVTPGEANATLEFSIYYD